MSRMILNLRGWDRYRLTQASSTSSRYIIRGDQSRGRTYVNAARSILATDLRDIEIGLGKDKIELNTVHAAINHQVAVNWKADDHEIERADEFHQ